MKKHIKKKSLHETLLTKEITDEIEASATGYPIHDMGVLDKFSSSQIPFITTDDNRMFQAFLLKHKGHNRLVPEPDPILIYFNAAYINYKEVLKLKDKFYQSLGEPLTEVNLQVLYDFFGAASVFVTLLFTAMEASLNRFIKSDFIYQKRGRNRTEMYDKSDIQWLAFEEKLKDVIPKFSNKQFSKDHPTKYTHISNLQEFRNMIIHTREEHGKSTYDYLFKKAISFKYSETIDAVKDFCNYYNKPDFIEDCNCSFDW